MTNTTEQTINENTGATKEEVFEFLDGLQEWGGVNMFGAGAYVEQAFDVSRRQSRNLVQEWMQTYKSRMQNKNQNQEAANETDE